MYIPNIAIYIAFLAKYDIILKVRYVMKTNKLDVIYVESKIEQPILWESHCHTQFEMIAVLEGDVNIMLEGKTYRLKENEMIVIPPLFYHSVTANEKGNYFRTTALFELDLIPKIIQNEFIKQGKTSTISPLQIQKIIKICKSERKLFYAPLLQSLMVELFYDTLNSTTLSTENKVDDFLLKALQYIDNHLHEKISLDDLAKVTIRSKSSFCHLFEEKMNVTPKQYILKKKLAIASKLIKEGVPKTLAASQVGYDNYSNFYRLYLKYSDNETENNNNL